MHTLRELEQIYFGEEFEPTNLSEIAEDGSRLCRVEPARDVGAGYMGDNKQDCFPKRLGQSRHRVHTNEQGNRSNTSNCRMGKGRKPVIASGQVGPRCTKALGLEVPPTLLALADEVIE